MVRGRTCTSRASIVGRRDGVFVGGGAGVFVGGGTGVFVARDGRAVCAWVMVGASTSVAVAPPARWEPHWSAWASSWAGRAAASAGRRPSRGSAWASGSRGCHRRRGRRRRGSHRRQASSACWVIASRSRRREAHGDDGAVDGGLNRSGDERRPRGRCVLGRQRIDRRLELGRLAARLHDGGPVQHGREHAEAPRRGRAAEQEHGGKKRGEAACPARASRAQARATTDRGSVSVGCSARNCLSR